MALLSSGGALIISSREEVVTCALESQFAAFTRNNLSSKQLCRAVARGELGRSDLQIQIQIQIQGLSNE